MSQKWKFLIIQSDEIKPWFKTLSARAQYIIIFKKKLMLQDKGFKLASDNNVDVSAFIRKTIDEQGWNLFCDV